jgi:hypothetical protein
MWEGPKRYETVEMGEGIGRIWKIYMPVAGSEGRDDERYVDQVAG